MSSAIRSSSSSSVKSASTQRRPAVSSQAGATVVLPSVTETLAGLLDRTTSITQQHVDTLKELYVLLSKRRDLQASDIYAVHQAADELRVRNARVDLNDPRLDRKQLQIHRRVGTEALALVTLSSERIAQLGMSLRELKSVLPEGALSASGDDSNDDIDDDSNDESADSDSSDESEECDDSGGGATLSPIRAARLPYAGGGIVARCMATVARASRHATPRAGGSTTASARGTPRAQDALVSAAPALAAARGSALNTPVASSLQPPASSSSSAAAPQQQPLSAAASAVVAAAAAAAAPALDPIPRHLPADSVDLKSGNASLNFFADWLMRSNTQLAPGMMINFDEIVQFATGSGGWGPCVHRRVMLMLANGSNHGKGKASTVQRQEKHSGPMFIEAQRIAAERCAGSGVVVAPTPRQKNVFIRTFQHCAIAYDVQEKKAFTYGAFPRGPGSTGTGQMSQAQLTALDPSDWRRHLFRVVAYTRPVQVVTTDEFMRVQQAIADAQATLNGCGPALPSVGPGSANAQLWTEQTFASDAERLVIVNETLRDMLESKRVPMARMVPAGEATQALRQLAANIMSSYPDASDVRKCELQRTIFALPRMHARRLDAPASPSTRMTHALRQLNPVQPRVCIERARPVERDPQQRRTLAPEEYQNQQVRVAFNKIMREDDCGRAHAALARQQAPHVPYDKQLETLQRLHPPDSSYPLTGVEMPHIGDYVYSPDDVPVEQLVKHAKSMRGAAPGPDGWTGEMLEACLESPIFARGLQHLIADICNGNIDCEIGQFLTASLLIGIPKGTTVEEGVRPLALGGVLLKVASATAMRATESKTKALFNGSQFGMMAEGGGDYIVHHTRRFVREGLRRNGERVGEGRLIATLDASNAFNTVLRQRMWEAIRDIPELHGLFAVSYSIPSMLLLSRMAVSHIMSRRGSRQGDVAGTLLFCLTIQRVINAINAVEGVEVLSYIDDLTLLCRDLAALQRAIAVAVAEFEYIGMSLNFKKCEVMACDDKTAATLLQLIQRSPEPLRSFSVEPCVKLLGASIARSDALEIAHLEQKRGMSTKLDGIFACLRKSASPQFMKLLSVCVVPKLNHLIRVHSHAVTEAICKRFDANVLGLVLFWANIETVPTMAMQLIVQLPRSRGGLGLTSMQLVAPCAHRASVEAAFRRGLRLSSQGQLTEAMYAEVWAKRVEPDAALKRQLVYNALPGGLDGLFVTSMAVHGDVFSAALRFTLGVASTTYTLRFPEGQQIHKCPGACSSCMFSGYVDWAHHTASCTAVTGGMVVRKHNSMCNELRHGSAQAGYDTDATEPRDMKKHFCGCGYQCPAAVWNAHRDVCSQAQSQKPFLHGPDIRCTPPGLAFGMRLALDVTFIDGMVRSHGGDAVSVASVAAAIARREEEKCSKYTEMCTASMCKFEPLVITTNGHMSSKYRAFVAGIAKRRGLNVTLALARHSALALFGTAAALLHHETLAGVRPPTRHAPDMQVVKYFKYDPLQDALRGAGTADETRLRAASPARPDQAGPALDELIARGLIASLQSVLPALFESVHQQLQHEQQQKRQLRLAAQRDAQQDNVRQQAAAASSAADNGSRRPALLKMSSEHTEFAAAVDSAARAAQMDEARLRLQEEARQHRRDIEARSAEHAELLQAATSEHHEHEHVMDVQRAAILTEMQRARDDSRVRKSISVERANNMAEWTQLAREHSVRSEETRAQLAAASAELQKGFEAELHALQTEVDEATREERVAAANARRQEVELRDATKRARASEQRLSSSQARLDHKNRAASIAISREVTSYSSAHVEQEQQQQPASYMYPVDYGVVDEESGQHQQLGSGIVPEPVAQQQPPVVAAPARAASSAAVVQQQGPTPAKAASVAAGASRSASLAASPALPPAAVVQQQGPTPAKAASVAASSSALPTPVAPTPAPRAPSAAATPALPRCVSLAAPSPMVMPPAPAAAASVPALADGSLSPLTPRGGRSLAPARDESMVGITYWLDPDLLYQDCVQGSMDTAGAVRFQGLDIARLGQASVILVVRNCVGDERSAQRRDMEEIARSRGQRGGIVTSRWVYESICRGSAIIGAIDDYAPGVDPISDEEAFLRAGDVGPASPVYTPPPRPYSASVNNNNNNNNSASATLSRSSTAAASTAATSGPLSSIGLALQHTTTESSSLSDERLSSSNRISSSNPTPRSVSLSRYGAEPSLDAFVLSPPSRTPVGALPPAANAGGASRTSSRAASRH